MRLRRDKSKADAAHEPVDAERAEEQPVEMLPEEPVEMPPEEPIEEPAELTGDESDEEVRALLAAEREARELLEQRRNALRSGELAAVQRQLKAAEERFAEERAKFENEVTRGPRRGRGVGCRCARELRRDSAGAGR